MFCKYNILISMHCILITSCSFINSILVLRQEMFYQIMMYEFGNFGVIKFSVSF